MSDERDIVERLRSHKHRWYMHGEFLLNEAVDDAECAAAEIERLAMLGGAKEAEIAAILDWIEQHVGLAERASAWCAAMDASGPIRQAYFDRRSAEREVQP